MCECCSYCCRRARRERRVLTRKYLRGELRVGKGSGSGSNTLDPDSNGAMQDAVLAIEGQSVRTTGDPQLGANGELLLIVSLYAACRSTH